MTRPTKRDLEQADRILSREARLEDVAVVAQLIADMRVAARCARCAQADR